MNRQIRDTEVDTLFAKQRLTLPILNSDTHSPSGSIAYNNDLQEIAVSNGSSWIPSGGNTGSGLLKVIPFGYDTPGISTGAPLYTPTAGELLLDGWIQVLTPWNGTTPLGDMGLISSGNLGVLSLMSAALGGNTLPYQDMTTTNQNFPIGYTYGNFVNTLSILSSYVQTNLVPGIFTSSDPWCVSVNSTGSVSGLPALTGAKGPVTLPLTVTAGVNDSFVFTGSGGLGTPETFTVAPGTYTNISALIAAVNNSTGSGEPFSTYDISISLFQGVIFMISEVNGPSNNGNTITAGVNDISAALGFTTPPFTFAGGTDPGSPSGSTTGTALLCLMVSPPS